MKKFVYTSATTCHTTIKVGEKEKEFSFFKDEVYDLPANDKFVNSMVAQGHLKIVKTSKTEK